MFVGFAAEEMGLIGSQKFVESGLLPNESVVAMINIDMIGRMTKKDLQISGTKTSTERGYGRTRVSKALSLNRTPTVSY